ncbi:MAG: hypothetical protein F6K42_13560 [Leptolyngbya sp. SIO1D8]|nr:hypothetical protein [Leptolyngbya sp. SIO1D8]
MEAKKIESEIYIYQANQFIQIIEKSKSLGARRMVIGEEMVLEISEKNEIIINKGVKLVPSTIS